MSEPIDQNEDSKENPMLTKADALRMGWWTGYSYNACESLYFEKCKIETAWEQLSDEEKNNRIEKMPDLLSELCTFQSLANEWKVNDSDKKVIQCMIGNTQQTLIAIECKNSCQTQPAKCGQVSHERFKTLYHSVRGIARGKNPCAYYTIDFSAGINKLDFTSKKNAASEIYDMEDKLSKVEKFFPNQSVIIMKNDMQAIKESTHDTLQAKETWKEKLLGSYKGDFEVEKKRTADWPDLVFGISNIKDLLTRSGKTWATMSYFLFMILIIFSVVLALILILNFTLPPLIGFIGYAFNIDLNNFNLASLATANTKDLIASISSIGSGLAGLGVFLTVIVKKLNSALKSMEERLNIFFAQSYYSRTICKDKKQNH